MNSFSSPAAPKKQGAWVPLLCMLPLAAVCCCYWYFTLTLLEADRNQIRLDRLIEQVDRVADRGVTDPRRLLVDLHVLLPQLTAVEPEGLEILRGSVDSLEAELAGQAGAGGAMGPVLAAVATVNQAMSQRAQTYRGYSGQQRDYVMALLVVLTLCAVGWVGISARRRLRPQSENAGSFREDMTELLFENVAVSAVVTDPSDTIVSVNDAYVRMTGYREDEAIGQEITFNHSGQQDERFFEKMRTKVHEDGFWSGEFWLRNKDGGAFSDKVTRRRLTAHDGSLAGYLTLSMDVVGTDDARRLMMWQAHHDPLTKLPNRNLFQERLTRVVLLAQSSESKSALISIDLDRFKMVNDSVGPAKADQILMQAAYRVAMCVQESDTVARLGSDHFAVVLAEIGDYGDAERIARSVVEEIQKPFVVDDRELFITSSVGVAVIPQDGDDAAELLQKADAARIQIKDDGGNGVAFFEPEINARAERRLGIESELRKAIALDQLMLYYQPVVDMQRGEITKAEALLRWQHPEFGMVSPGEFIPVAEDTGMIVEIGQWVLQEVQRQLAAWRADGLDELDVSLNVSSVQIRKDCDADAFLQCLAAAEHDGIILELTESALIENSDGVHRFLQGARSLGCKVALDDFGTGFSSLGYLRSFEFDVLKIDKTFIDELENTRDHGLVASIVSMGRILGMRVVAEGVEEAAQVERLRQIGCDYVQGFYYSKPLPAEEFFRFVTNGELRDVG